MNTGTEPWILRVLIRLVLIGACVGTVLAAFSRWFWFAELFSHFRLYYLLAQALLIVVFIHRRHPILLGITLVLTVPNALSVGPYLLPLIGGGAAPTPTDRVTVVALNLNYRNGNAELIRDYIQSQAPDVLLLEEFTPRWQGRLAGLSDMYPHEVVGVREGAFGMALYSRLPLADIELIDLGAADTTQISAVIDTGAGELYLIGVHLFPPMSAEQARLRNRQLDELAQLVVNRDWVLVIGDLNVTPYSPYFRRLLDRSGLVDARRPQGIHVTWPAYPIPLWIPIDHGLASPGLPVTDVRRGPSVGTDHYPLEITIGLR